MRLQNAHTIAPAAFAATGSILMGLLGSNTKSKTLMKNSIPTNTYNNWNAVTRAVYTVFAGLASNPTRANIAVGTGVAAGSAGVYGISSYMSSHTESVKTEVQVKTEEKVVVKKETHLAEENNPF